MKTRESFNHIVRYFVKNCGGFLIVSQDEMFLRIFNRFIKVLNIPEESVRRDIFGKQYIKEISFLLKHFKHIVVFIDSCIEGRNNVPYFRQIKDLLDDKVTIICLCNESFQNDTSLFLEMGADSTLVKPVSVDIIIKKIAFAIKPNNFRELVNKAQKAIVSNNFSVAQTIAEDILKAYPKSTIAYILLGDIHLREKNYFQAENAYQKAAKYARMHLQPLERLIDLYTETGQTGEKLRILKLLDKISPLNHERKMTIAEVCSQLGKPKECIFYSKEALDLVEKQANEMMAWALMETGKKLKDIDPEQSLEYMIRAFELKAEVLGPGDLWMLNEMGLNLRKQGRLDEALKYYHMAQEIAPDDWNVAYNLGIAYLQAKKYDMACEYAEKALECYPELLNFNASIPYNIARIYYHLNRYSEAQQYAKIACITDHNHQEAQKLLKKLEGALIG